jgi:hypothetical protein
VSRAPLINVDEDYATIPRMPLFSWRRRETASLPFNLSTQGQWSERAERAVSLWEQHASDGAPVTVADLGAGNARIASLMTRPGTTYIGYDLLPQHHAINQWDLRNGPPHPAVDVAFLLGVVEYLPLDNRLIEQLHDFTRQVVVSYVGLDETTISIRKRKEQLGWKRHESFTETERRFIDAGFRLVDKSTADEGLTRIWLWDRVVSQATRR